MIKTIINENIEIGNNQIAPLKGKAFHKLIFEQLEKPSAEDQSLKKLFKEIITSKELPLIYKVNLSFRINNTYIFEKGIYITEEDIVSGNISGKEEFRDKNPFILKCTNPKCKNKQTILKTTRIKGKCTTCNSKRDYPIRRLEHIKVHALTNTKKESFEFLIKNNFIEEYSHILKRRVDGIHFINKKLIIIECKNWEKTGINNSTLDSALFYPLILKQLNKFIPFTTNYLDFYINGLLNIPDKHINSIKSVHNIDLWIFHGIDWIKNKHYNSVIIDYNNIKEEYEYLLFKSEDNLPVIIINSIKLFKKVGGKLIKIKNSNLICIEKSDEREEIAKEIMEDTLKNEKK